jgi:glucose/arabinose dehydrogenase
MRRFPSVLTIVALLLLNGCPARKGEVADRSRMTARAEPQSEQLGLLKLPAGFRTGLFASGLRAPRMMALSPDGRLFVTEMRAGRVTILPDANGDGRTDGHITYASGLDDPHGIAFHRGYLYVAETGRVIRYRYREGDTKAPRPNVVVPDLPTGGGHFTRTISFGPDGKLYVSVGSSCNVCIEKSPLRAAITRYDADGSDRRIVATGLRNSVGLAWNPKTDELWATDNGRDYLGDDLPPEEVNVIREGGFYGWPYAYGDRVPDPDFGDQSPAKVKSSIPPKIKIQAHSAPLGLAFYTGDMFPAEYRGDLFICYHGSWNRSVPTGYKVVRFDIEDGRVVGGQHDFITGWLQGDEAWGRPVGLLVGRHGELFITDDSGGRVYRVTYKSENG